MKYSFLIFILISLLRNYNYQDDKCIYYDFYKISLDKYKKNKEKNPMIVEFNYEMIELLQKSLFNSNLIDDEEKIILRKELNSDNEFKICTKLENELRELDLNETEEKLDEYIYYKYNYSKPIFVSDNKVYLFSENLIIKKNRGVAGGSNIMHIFNRKNGRWYLNESKVIAWY